MRIKPKNRLAGRAGFDLAGPEIVLDKLLFKDKFDLTIFKYIEALTLGYDELKKAGLSCEEMIKRVGEQAFENRLSNYLFYRRRERSRLQERGISAKGHFTDFIAEDSEPTDNLGDRILAEFNKRDLSIDEQHIAHNYLRNDFIRAMKHAYHNLREADRADPLSGEWTKYMLKARNLADRAALAIERLELIVPVLIYPSPIPGDRPFIRDNNRLYQKLEMDLLKFLQKYDEMADNPTTYRLQRQLADAIRNERYEEAARLRDSIRTAPKPRSPTGRLTCCV
jgi:hypothetical protein